MDLHVKIAQQSFLWLHQALQSNPIEFNDRYFTPLIRLRDFKKLTLIIYSRVSERRYENVNLMFSDLKIAGFAEVAGALRLDNLEKF